MTLGNAHVIELRQLSDPERVTEPVRKLEDDLQVRGLAEWDAGWGPNDDGQRVQLRPSQLVITEAGLAALRFYDLGRQIAAVQTVSR